LFVEKSTTLLSASFREFIDYEWGQWNGLLRFRRKNPPVVPQTLRMPQIEVQSLSQSLKTPSIKLIIMKIEILPRATNKSKEMESKPSVKEAGIQKAHKICEKQK
jgi:hypothetical protein